MAAKGDYPELTLEFLSLKVVARFGSLVGNFPANVSHRAGHVVVAINESLFSFKSNILAGAVNVQAHGPVPRVVRFRLRSGSVD